MEFPYGDELNMGVCDSLERPVLKGGGLPLSIIAQPV